MFQSADDSPFVVAADDAVDLDFATQGTLTSMTRWFGNNYMTMNIKKSKLMMVSLSYSKFPQTDSCKVLGLLIDNHLSWSEQIKHTARKLLSLCFLMLRIRDTISIEVRRLLYFSLFQGVMSYGLLVWGNSPHVKDLLIIQKRFLRIMLYMKKHESCRAAFKEHKLMTVINLYIFVTLLYIKKNIVKYKYVNSVHDHATRNANMLSYPLCGKTTISRSFEFVGVKLLNKLPGNVSTLPIKIFKSRICKWLQLNPFYSISEFFEADVGSI